METVLCTNNFRFYCLPVYLYPRVNMPFCFACPHGLGWHTPVDAKNCRTFGYIHATVFFKYYLQKQCLKESRSKNVHELGLDMRHWRNPSLSIVGHRSQVECRPIYFRCVLRQKQCQSCPFYLRVWFCHAIVSQPCHECTHEILLIDWILTCFHGEWNWSRLDMNPHWFIISCWTQTQENAKYVGILLQYPFQLSYSFLPNPVTRSFKCL